MKTNVEVVVCWIKSGTQELNELIGNDEPDCCHQPVISANTITPDQSDYGFKQVANEETADIKYLKYLHL